MGGAGLKSQLQASSLFRPAFLGSEWEDRVASESLALFLAAFLAATLVPAQSELGLAVLATRSPDKAWLFLAVASLGNTLGSVVNWGLGQGLARFQDRRWFPFKPSQIAAARRRYARFGYWSLLLSWVPVVGDPLTLIAGVMKEPLWRFLLLVAFAKTARYVTVLWAASLF